MPPPIVPGRPASVHNACPKCKQESGVVREGNRWFCNVCANSWSDAPKPTASSLAVEMQMRTVGIMRVL